MSYLNRAWIAATVAVVNGQADGQGHKLKSGLRTFQHGKKRFSTTSSSSSAVDPADLRPLSAILGSDGGGFVTNSGEDRRKQADESLKHAMYMNCWGPS